MCLSGDGQPEGPSWQLRTSGGHCPAPSQIREARHHTPGMYVWRGRRWQSWLRSCHEAQLPEGPLLQGVGGSDNEGAETSPVPWSTFTTHATLLLLLKWSGAHQQNGRCFLAPAADQLLRALLGHLPDSFVLETFCSEVSWRPPYTIEGGGRAAFHIQGGVVDLGHAQLSQPAVFSVCLPSLQEQGACTLLELSWAAPCMEKPGASEHGWLPQYPVAAWQPLGASFAWGVH